MSDFYTRDEQTQAAHDEAMASIAGFSNEQLAELIERAKTARRIVAYSGEHSTLTSLAAKEIGSHILRLEMAMIGINMDHPPADAREQVAWAWYVAQKSVEAVENGFFPNLDDFESELFFALRELDNADTSDEGELSSICLGLILLLERTSDPKTRGRIQDAINRANALIDNLPKTGTAP